MERDIRTTPSWLQWPGLGLLTVLICYFALCGHATLNKYDTRFGRDHYWGAWMGSWWMFTYRTRWHTAIELLAQVGDDWVDVPAEELFPTRWESGLRYERRYFREVPYLAAVLAQATCRRMEAQGQAPVVVRVQSAKWKKQLGETRGPIPVDAKREEILTLPCETEVPLPEGRRL